MQVTLDEFLAKHFEAKLEDVIQRAYEQGVEDGRKRYSLPPMMTRKRFMEFAEIGESKCAELFNRKDFPVNREFGHPRVPTNLLLKWIEVNTEWVNTNAPVLRSLERITG